MSFVKLSSQYVTRHTNHLSFCFSKTLSSHLLYMQHRSSWLRSCSTNVIYFLDKCFDTYSIISYVPPRANSHVYEISPFMIFFMFSSISNAFNLLFSTFQVSRQCRTMHVLEKFEICCFLSFCSKKSSEPIPYSLLYL